jgi:hypothetical protein
MMKRKRMKPGRMEAVLGIAVVGYLGWAQYDGVTFGQWPE